VGQAQAVARPCDPRSGPDHDAAEDDHHGPPPADDDDHGSRDDVDQPAGHLDLHESEHDHHVDRLHDRARLDHELDVGDWAGKGPRRDAWAWSTALQFGGRDVDSRDGQR
jgi:hypothetical protein